MNIGGIGKNVTIILVETLCVVLTQYAWAIGTGMLLVFSSYVPSLQRPLLAIVGILGIIPSLVIGLGFGHLLVSLLNRTRKMTS